MKLIVINSNSAGNSYALDAGGEILLLEAGMKMADVKRAINFRLQDVVGCVVTHVHGDHAKYATEYAKFGVKVYCNDDVVNNKYFPFGMSYDVMSGKTYHIGSFSVTPFDVAHDVPCLGYLVRHPEMGILLFATDTYKLPVTFKGVDHFLIEANYSDELLKQNVWKGSINKAQADRIMLSHMSLEYTVNYLLSCDAKSAKTITLCHLSERNSDPDMFKQTVAGAFGVPTFIAKKNLIIDLSKEII